MLSLSKYSASYLIFLLTALVVKGQSRPAEDASKPVKTVVTLIRKGNDGQVFKQVDMNSVSRYLLGDYYGKATKEQLTEFNSLFQTVFSKIAFPRIRENFKELSSIAYETPKVEGTRAQVGSTIFIKHPLKMQEMKLKYILGKTTNGWKLTDVTILGDSMMESIRDDQVRPLLAAGGMEKLLGELRTKSRN
ncbi:ABC transporter substrate-binding protein [Paraflavitalea soli]|uniref:ABC transporter substrate-binding protein n=1 Tax=Paraflavitalea soli TaxID=2315862 RepID=A0A3B7MQ68_9BACT|nr:ABC transporter substrate-binding protein [Paraflavitalea soli]AXY73725.1 ABC transporter substrate-binding protein [Paraflavitalea soli]